MGQTNMHRFSHNPTSQAIKRSTWSLIALALAFVLAASLLPGFAQATSANNEASADEPITITVQVEGYDGGLPVLEAGKDFTAGDAVQADPTFMEDEDGNQPLAELIETKQAEGLQLEWTDEEGNSFDWFSTPVTHSVTITGTFVEADFEVRVSFNDDGATDDVVVSVPKGQSFREAYGSVPSEPTKAGWVFVRWVDGATGSAFDFGGYLEVQKTSANPNLTNGLSTYSLEGAVFGVYNTKGECVARLTTDSSGKTARTDLLPVGTYTVREKTAPTGYAVAAEKTVSITAGNVTRTTVADAPQCTLVDLLIQKFDAETDAGLPLGAASLENALFTVTYYDRHLTNAEASTAANAGTTAQENSTLETMIASWGAPERSWSFATDAQGQVRFSEDCLVEGDAFYYDSTGAVVLPLGTIVIEEAGAPTGYLSTDALIVRDLQASSTQERIGTWANATFENQVKRGDFSFTKVASDTMERMAGVPFSITSTTTGESHVIVTDENGMASTASTWAAHSHNTNAGESSEDGLWFGQNTDGTTAPVNDSLGALPYDTYTVEELACATNEGFELVSFNVTVRRDGVTLDIGTVDNERLPIEISGEVDKRQTIADDNGVFAYSIDYRSTSNTWVDEFTMVDELACTSEGLAYLTSLTTPVCFEDYDGTMNVWYQTNLDEASGDSDTDTAADKASANQSLPNASATNPTNPKNPNNERVRDFSEWHLWQEGVSTLESAELSVASLGLSEGEHITAIAFEHGRIEQGFGTNAQDAQDWQRRERYWETDSFELPLTHSATFDLSQASGLTQTESKELVAYAPAILHMQAAESALTEGAFQLINDASVDLHRNLTLHDEDFDTVSQTIFHRPQASEDPEPAIPLPVELPKTEDLIAAAPFIAVAPLVLGGIGIAAVRAHKRRMRKEQLKDTFLRRL